LDLSGESSFRLVFGLFWFLNLALRIYFQAKARGAKKSVSRHERRAKLGFRLLAVSYVLMLVYCLSPWFDFAHFSLPGWMRWLFGGTTLMLYLVLFAWAHIALGRHWSGLLEIHQDHVLVTHGPYRYIRHPMYCAFFLMGIGSLLLSANWFISGLYLLAATSLYFDRLAPEEEMMIERFGDSYRDYMKRTGRLVPRFNR